MDKITFDSDKPMNILGVDGRLTHRTVKPGKPGDLWFKQRWISVGRPVDGYGTNGEMRVELRFDDECGNGHSSFAITAEVRTTESRRMRDIAAGGCMHDEIARIFPELESLIKWHLCSTDGPMHYLANTIYFAGDRDCNGCRKGQPTSFDNVVYFGNSPVSHKIGRKFAEFLKARMYLDENGVHVAKPELGEFRVIAIPHVDRPGETYKFAPYYTFVGFGERWHECPFKDQKTAEKWAMALNTIGAKFTEIPTAFSEGKARELGHARCAAIWPEATDEELSQDPAELKAALLARLPGLLAEFRSTMASVGFYWAPSEFPN